MKVGIVTRKLVVGNIEYVPVVSAVFEEPDDPNVDDLEGYFNSRMADHAKDFAEKLVEFKNATWELTILDTRK